MLICFWFIPFVWPYYKTIITICVILSIFVNPSNEFSECLKIWEIIWHRVPAWMVKQSALTVVYNMMCQSIKWTTQTRLLLILRENLAKVSLLRRLVRHWSKNGNSASFRNVMSSWNLAKNQIRCPYCVEHALKIKMEKESSSQLAGPSTLTFDNAAMKRKHRRLTK